MLEPIGYFILGSALVLGLFGLAPDDRKSRTAPEEQAQLKRQSRGCFGCGGCLSRVLFPLMVVMGVFYLVLAVVLAVDLYGDWSEYRLLNEKGEVRTVPLLRVVKEYGPKKPVYEATYQIDGSTREQSISKSQYERLKSQNSVEVWVYKNTSRIVGSKPAYFLITIIMGLGTLGGLITGATLIALLKAIWKRLQPHHTPVD